MPKSTRADAAKKSFVKNDEDCEIKSLELSVDNRPTVKIVPQMSLPSFPKVEGGRDFDEEVEERIWLTHAYNSQIADSNTRALSARGLHRTAEVDSPGNLLVCVIEQRTKSKFKQNRTINE